MTPTKHHSGPKRGEIGLAKFHRMLGVASFGAAMCLMGASFTALFWFAGVIGLPTAARFAVAVAIEVMAATTAASATTAYKEDGKVSLSAWAGFAFFIGLAAYANVLHVVIFVDESVAPDWFGRTQFVVAACVFAAACPLGGTWGVHRFGWLRAHGADAHWTDTEDGIIAHAPAPRPRTAQPKPRAHTAPPAQTSAPELDAQPSAQETAQESDTAAEKRAVVAEAERLLAAGEELVAADIRRRLGVAAHSATVRRWVTEVKSAQPAAQPDLRAEVRLADPPAQDDAPEPATARAEGAA